MIIENDVSRETHKVRIGGNTMKNTNALKNSIKGALYGVAVGDALGAPLEFMNADQIERQHGRVTTMIGGGWLSVRPGEITDDTQMTLAVAEGIAANPENPIEEVGARFVEWFRSGPKDVGATCSSSIGRARSLAAAGKSLGSRPTEGEWFNASRSTAKRNGNRSGGNGALMRTVYPGLFYSSELEAVEVAVAIAQMTHWDDASNEACELYTRVIHYFTEAIYNREQQFEHILSGTKYDLGILVNEMATLTPSGYVVDSFRCAVAAFWTRETFRETVEDVANMGGDADTIAAIAGGIAGAYYGYEAIPADWIDALDEDVKARLDALTDKAVENRQRPEGGKED